ncbi:NAD(P)H-quinone oxidoreductase [Dichotomicrobium thermohalophilum]|uniref:Putative PIG3 family NAD(P)H quinone oxidoreductase n=1 Tax=Dichotomicrobium thermohalophilum TaxID=933063 RepID=A0A397PH38_9HYPH|nr:NAD(P)H-quinone oxidoreductase [Dichotomicrobium thermohalophilum]RIA47813.1 putative PIG3 family NAD(P)H quinone oxidoreductase [Dichotomicrobium thermohalophilum]
MAEASPIPEQMTAISITEPGGPEVLQPHQMEVPEPGPCEVLVRLAAAGVNRPDVMQRQGMYPPPKGASPIPGLEVAGEVVAAGPEVTRYKPGDQVCALVTGGGYADYCVASEGATLPVPAGMDVIEAAALPETFFTVWINVFERAGLQPGEVFLVHGGTSGIGTTAIQLASALGARVFATARGPEKGAICTELGAERAIDYETEDFVEVVKSATDGHGADVILDMVGGDYIQRNIACAAEDGRIHQIAFLRGSKVEVDFMRMMLKRITLTGSTLRARPTSVKAHVARALEEKVWPLLASGKVRPVIDSRYPLTDAAEAHRRMESSAHVGKILLVTGG